MKPSFSWHDLKLRGPCYLFVALILTGCASNRASTETPPPASAEVRGPSTTEGLSTSAAPPKASSVPLTRLPLTLSVTLSSSSTPPAHLPPATTSTRTPFPLSTLPTSPIPATLAALPPGPSIEHSRIILQSFIAAYNNHDVLGVLVLFSDARFGYGDCDYTRAENVGFSQKDDLAAWLQNRFSEHDHFEVVEMEIATSYGYPPNDPRVTSIVIRRTNDELQALHLAPIELGTKIILSWEGDRISMAAIGSRVPFPCIDRISSPSPGPTVIASEAVEAVPGHDR